MKQNNQDKLKGSVDADETLVGGYTNKNKGRSLESKEALLLAAEKLPDGRTGNIRMQHIENFEALTLKYALKDMIDEQATISKQTITASKKKKKKKKKKINLKKKKTKKTKEFF